MYNENMDMYVLDIAALAGREEEALSLLSPDRREKALRLRGESRLRSLAGGLLLRRYIGPGPYVIGARGKPSLPGGQAFSLSHSGRYCALAIGKGRVGIDIERMDEANLPALELILREDEQAGIRKENRLRDFYTLWTRKEALAKAIGTGLFRDPREIDLKQYEEKHFTTEFKEEYCLSTYEEYE